MPLDSAGKAMIAQEFKHHHDMLKLITSIRFTIRFLEKDSGWLTLDAK